MIKLSSAEEKTGELLRLKSRANMLASMHSSLADRYLRYHNRISSAILVISTLLVGFTFASNCAYQQSSGLFCAILPWVLGSLSILNFAGVLLLSQWRLDEKAAMHREAVRFYFKIVNRIRTLLADGDEIRDEDMESIMSDYSKTESLPKIPEKRFLKLKQDHLQKVAISKELDNTPFDSIDSIRERVASSEN